MTQIHPEYIDLAQIVEQAELIVVATPTDPPHRTEIVSILPPGSEFEGKNDPPYSDDAEFDPDVDGQGRLDRNYPPFSRMWYGFAVSEVLKGETSVAGASIETRAADDGTHLGGHQLYYIQGIGESPICETYAPSARPGADDARILFIYALRDGTGYEFVAEGAVEVLAKRADVESLIPQGRGS
jgi:hypothetical protein